MTHASENHRSAARGSHPRGLTLIELLVVTGVLSALILVVSTMLTQSQRTIQISQTAIRGGANVRAALAHIRRDVSAVSRDGFLLICSPVRAPKTGTNLQTDNLVFTTVGHYQSLVDATVANAARIEYGVTGLDIMQPEGLPRIVWRRAILLDPGNSQVQAADHEKMALSYYLANAFYWPMPPPGMLTMRWPIDMAAIGPYSVAYPDGSSGTMPCMTKEPDFKFPIVTLADLEAAWPFMLPGVKHMYVQWTDGRLDATGSLRWYGRGNPRDGGWLGKTPMTDEQGDKVGVSDLPEYNMKMDPGMGQQLAKESYAALWTCRNKSNWPKALRIELELADPPQLFEVVVALPK